MKCPKCPSQATVYTAARGDSWPLLRWCPACGHTWETCGYFPGPPLGPETPCEKPPVRVIHVDPKVLKAFRDIGAMRETDKELLSDTTCAEHARMMVDVVVNPPEGGKIIVERDPE